MRFILTSAGLISRGGLQWQPTRVSHGDNWTVLPLESQLFALKRELSAAFRNAVEASASGELVLVFATITHDDLPETIRVVSEDQGGVSYKNGLIVNYRYGGELYLGCPFLLDLLTDDERPPRSRVTVPDVDRTIGLEILALTDSPQIKIEILKLSDFSDAVDADNARNPIGAPTVEYTADYLFLKNVAGDAIVLQADIQSKDLVGEPWPKTRSTPDRLPGLAF